MINNELLENSKIIFSHKRNISETIGDDYIYKWTPATPIFISAQTGSGKNTFVKELISKLMLGDFAIKYNFLILSNRIGTCPKLRGTCKILE